MSPEEFEEAKNNDAYLQTRKRNQDYEIRLFLHEVNFCCPLCGKLLQSRYQKKPAARLFEIAHIYPNSPTQKQYETLAGLERLGTTCEDFENKIALCKDCHDTYDFRTTKDEYLKLVNTKKILLKKTQLEEIVNSAQINEQISLIVQKLAELRITDSETLKYTAIPLSKKFSREDPDLLKSKVSSYVTKYYFYIRELFHELDGNGDFSFDILAKQIRLCFERLVLIEKNKNQIFSNMVEWIKSKTFSQSTEACEAVVSFFIQNCEVFDEITE